MVIKETIEETPTVRTLVFRDVMSHRAKAGQFLMTWIPGIDEIPMSVMVHSKRNHAAVTIRRVGYGSTALYNKKVGEMLGIRGPYGNYFKIPSSISKALLVGGGTGLVPLMRLAKDLSQGQIYTTLIMGAKNKAEVFFEQVANELLRETSHSVIVTTEDGSYGLKGKSTEAMSKIITLKEFDIIYTCGPELMMKEVFDIACRYSLPIQASLERHMKCGIGICASCCIDEFLVCKDGTIFNEGQLSRIVDFGRACRDKSGKKMYYS